MTWTILVLVVAIAMFLFGGMLFIDDGKKATTDTIIAKKAIKLVSILLIAGCVCRLYVPYYLTSVNPEIVMEMVDEAKNGNFRKTLRANVKTMAKNAPIMGNRDAKKTIYVWTDFSCPYCRRVHGELERVLAERDDVRVVVKNFSIHGALSDAPARAVIAANMQDPDKADALVRMLMTREFYSQDDLSDQENLAQKVEANVLAIAGEAGLDTARMSEDMNSAVVAEELSQVRDLAQAFEINGTPFLIIGEKSFPGAIPYGQIVDALNN